VLEQAHRIIADDSVDHPAVIVVGGALNVVTSSKRPPGGRNAVTLNNQGHWAY
jgi:hypothetical protein